jgi:hypothetical protein
MSLLWKTAVAQPDYISHRDLAGMYSGDFDVPMTRVRRELNDEYRNLSQDHRHCGSDDTLEDHGVHSMDVKHGGPDAYIEHLKRDIAANGMREPLTIRGGNVVTDGQHRGVAALDLRMERIPVEHVR